MAADAKYKKAGKTPPDGELGFHNLMDQSKVSIQIHTPDGKLFKSNDAYAELYALSKDVLIELYEKYNVLQDDQAEKLGLMPYIKKSFEGKIQTLI